MEHLLDLDHEDFIILSVVTGDVIKILTLSSTKASVLKLGACAFQNYDSILALMMLKVQEVTK